MASTRRRKPIIHQDLCEIDRPGLPAKRPASPHQREEGDSGKKFMCDPCDQGFTTQRALRRHERESDAHSVVFGTAKQSFTCPHPRCRTTFARAHDKERHVREQHGNGQTPPLKRGKACRTQPIVVKAGPTAANSPSGAQGVHIDVCEGLCFMQLADAKPQGIQALASIPEAVYQNETRMTAAKRYLPCGICRQNFEIFIKTDLFRHLENHFADLWLAPHVCWPCSIAFVHAADSKRHLQSAARGKCGFSFHHERPCYGHHPPRGPEGPLSNAGHPLWNEALSGSEGGYADDRRKYENSIRSWEQVQLSDFSSSMNVLVQEGLPSAKTISVQPVRLKANLADTIRSQRATAPAGSSSRR